MKKKRSWTKIILMLLLFFFCLLLQAQSRVDWEEGANVKIDAVPIDIARSQDGEYTFILIEQGSVLIYTADGTQVGTIPVDPSVKDIAISSKGDQLYLISGEQKSLQTISISFIEEIDIIGSPFLGPAAARVAVVVFSDFQ
jgi:hypothetical protein